MAPRRLLVSVDDSDCSERMVKYVREELYRPNDEIHIIHVIPRLHANLSFGAPTVDMLTLPDPASTEEVIREAEKVLVARALCYLDGLDPCPVVHLVKNEMDTDSIGQAICAKALELEASLVVLAKRSKSKLQQLFLGSVSSYCVSHCALPVLVHG